ncbi:class I SAM-dependent methyltransferase [Leptolyngbya sp. NK1-12]|uniref:Class I SAM-dependent methyltransferase n=2 Tax=Leptolyngbya sp. NK1-12 TaxID=2547451 RepID=A0AA96WY70_9CYAN|nr:class I SAM-dependent methyltransferase [Leptolyngbya sp. NK1-12]
MGPQYSANQIRPLETLLLSALSANARLLDLCCGTGQLVQELMQRGYSVTGLDGSEAMLDYAHQNAPQAEFVLADARRFHLPDQFDAIVSTSASLNHIISIDDLKAVFRCVYVALRDNGWFLFDLNHPAQMARWWRGRPVEGEIAENYAWVLTPVYDPQNDSGYFKIVLFRSQSASSHPLRRMLYRILSLRWLTRLRLKALNRFQNWEPNWRRSEMIYHVRGYPEATIRQALAETGFTEISVQTIDGNPQVDNKHSAYFRCRKPANGK